MAGFWQQVQLVFWNIIHRPTVIDCIDILLIAFLIYKLIQFTKGTQAIQAFKGLAIVIVVSYVSEFLGLTTVNWIFRAILNNGIVLFLILFQPEIKKVLAQIGRSARPDHMLKQDESQRYIDEITQCLLRLSRRRVGALIVFEQKTGLKDFMETGTSLDAEISSGLLENIFEPNTPLHDGAVIIRDTRIAAAACILSLSNSDTISHDLGTRHRAALGISENTDATVLIVSEENGIISMARGGKLSRHLDAEGLRKILKGIYHEEPSLSQRLLHCFDRFRKGGSVTREEEQ